MENFKICVACGMPLDHPEDIALTVENHAFCVHCVDENGKVKSCTEIFNGGVEFFMQTFPEMGQKMAEKVTRKNMLNLPYWKGKEDDCLKGEVATDEEFEAVLAKLQG